jgi:hypothetical protein
MKMGRGNRTQYLPPGGDESEWQIVDEQERRELRAEARKLLARADESLAAKFRQLRAHQGEMLVFERDMARAVGAWDRWVSAQSRKLAVDADRAVHEAAARAKRSFRKIFGLKDED